MANFVHTETQDKLMTLLYESKLPKLYRDADIDVDFALKRFLQTIVDGGYSFALHDAEGLRSLINPVTCPDEFFPMLYESFGLTYYNDIDIRYQRKFLSNYGEIMRRKGTYACVNYLVRTVTGIPVTLTYTRSHKGQEGRFLVVTLVAETMEQLEGIDTSIQVIQRFVQDFVPFFVDAVVVSQVNTQSVQQENFYTGGITVFYSYCIVPA